MTLPIILLILETQSSSSNFKNTALKLLYSLYTLADFA